tara:strand:- start:147 stop:392 length:246 start_codon:yes stop_codon:yes gene_type:complete
VEWAIARSPKIKIKVLKAIDSFGATRIIQLPYFKNNNFHVDALYVKTSRDDRNGVSFAISSRVVQTYYTMNSEIMYRPDIS